MSFKTLMVIKALVCLFFGVVMLAAPITLFSLFGAEMNDASAFTSREYAAAMSGIMFICWFGRNAVESDIRKGTIIGLTIYDAIGFVITLIAVLNGTFNALGWMVVALYLFLALGFGWFWLKPPKP